MTRVFVTGIGTGVGKTLVSAILSEKLAASYWKPIQCGNLKTSDTHTVMRLTKKATVIEEAYRFRFGLSPHAAAARDGVTIRLSKLRLPVVRGNLVVEGAGGVLVPLNSENTFIDLAKRFDFPTILVSRHYLGSINHTLLSIEALRNARLSILGVVFIGDKNPSTETAIARIGKVEVLGRIPLARTVTKKFISEQGKSLSC